MGSKLAHKGPRRRHKAQKEIHVKDIVQQDEGIRVGDIMHEDEDLEEEAVREGDRHHQGKEILGKTKKYSRRNSP